MDVRYSCQEWEEAHEWDEDRALARLRFLYPGIFRLPVPEPLPDDIITKQQAAIELQMLKDTCKGRGINFELYLRRRRNMSPDELTPEDVRTMLQFNFKVLPECSRACGRDCEQFARRYPKCRTNIHVVEGRERSAKS